MDRNWRGSIPRTSRYHTAINRERPDPHSFFVQRAYFCTRALLVHVFVVRVLYDDNFHHRVNTDED
jgi:hypothetical protein